MTRKSLIFLITILLFANLAYAGTPKASYRPGDTVRVIVTSNNAADVCSVTIYDPSLDKYQGSVLSFHSGGGVFFAWTGFWVVPATTEFGDWSGISVLWDTVGVNTRVGGGNTIWSIADTFFTVTTLLDKDGYVLTAAEKESMAVMVAQETLNDSSHYKSLLTADDIATRILADTAHYQAKGVGITQADKESIAVTTAREVLNDSSHYQGSASGLTADAIALAMWSSLHADYADSAGSFGAYIDVKISDMGVILGSKPVRVYLKDAADSTILGNVEVQLYNKNDTTYSDLIYVNYTNTSGWIDLNLDTLTYWLRWEHPQYIASADSFIVADDDTMQGFTFYATAFSPPSPSVDSTCVVWGRLRKATGEYAADIKVQFILEPSDPAFYMEKLLDRRKVETMTDSIGFWSVAVYPNSRITPLGTGYKVKIWGDPKIEDIYIVPADTSAAFNSLERWDD